MNQISTIRQGHAEVIQEEFTVPADKVNGTVAMCQIVAYYHLVKAVDNSSNIYYYLR